MGRMTTMPGTGILRPGEVGYDEARQVWTHGGPPSCDDRALPGDQGRRGGYFAGATMKDWRSASGVAATAWSGTPCPRAG